MHLTDVNTLVTTELMISHAVSAGNTGEISQTAWMDTYSQP